MSRRLRIALFPDADARWIAGVLYVETIVRALRTLPDAEVPELHLVARRKESGPHYDPLREATDTYQVFEKERRKRSGGSLVPLARRLLGGSRGRRDLAACLRDAGADLILPVRRSLPAEIDVPAVGWIPDFQHRHLPDFFTPEQRSALDSSFQELINRSCRMLVSSEDARQDITRFYRVDPGKVSVYSFRTEAKPGWFAEDPAATARRYNLPEKFLMFPSQFWQHKNHLVLFRAIAALRTSHPDLCLVLTGADSDFRNQDHPQRLHQFIRAEGLQERIRHLGLLPRGEQIQLMRRAAAVVQPSLFEGWSMLVEDCRVLGKEIILSDLPVHKEQAYARAHYFARSDASELATLLDALWPDLVPGPDPAAEAAATVENQELVRTNGRCLRRIFEGALGQEATRQPVIRY